MSRFPRRFRWVRWVVLLVGLYGLAGFFAVPPLVRSQLPKRLSAALGRTVTIGGVRVNPFALSATLENVNVTERDRRGAFFGWERLYVNFDPLASLFGEWVIGAVELDGFQSNVAIGADGALNFADLLADAKGGPAVESSGGKAPRPVRVGRLQVTRAQVKVRDESHRQAFTTVVGPVTFVVNGFRTSGRADSPYAFEATTEAGEKIAWRGTLTAAPLRSSGEFHLGEVLLPKYAPYYSESLNAVVEGGRLSVNGHYDANFGGGARKLVVKDATVALRDLRLVEPGATKPLLNLPKLDVTGIEADALARRVVVARVVSEGGSVSVRRDADGHLNWQRVVAPRRSDAPAVTGGSAVAPAAASGASQPIGKPEVQVAEIAISGLKVQATDLTLPRPAELTLNALKASVKNFSLADGGVMPVQMGFDWAPEGAVQISGTVAWQPELDADVVVVATKAAVAPVSAYLESQVNARLAAGLLSMESRVRASNSAGRLTVNVAGDASLSGVKITAMPDNEPLAGWSDLKLQDFSVTTDSPLKLSLEAVSLVAPKAHIVRRPDGTLNVASWRRAPASPLAATAAESGLKPTVVSVTAAAARKPSAESPQISIGRVTVNDGDFTFADQAIEPAVRMGLTRFEATVTGLSSEGGARAEVDMSASVDGSGPMKLTGQFDPLGREKSARLMVDLRNVDLVPFSPYAAKFAGYELARGKLQVDVKFLMQDSALNSADVITLDQFTWGAASHSPDATKLPVRLGVALLKDRSGKIVLDVPVEGNLNDPNFRVGRVVWRVIGNVLAKAATSPFALLGSMFGGGGDELSWQEFAPGSTALEAGEEKKLATLVKALTERPGLSVGIEGGYDADADRTALRERKWETQLRAHVQRTRDGGDAIAAGATAETAAPTAEERADAVKAWYAQVFPKGNGAAGLRTEEGRSSAAMAEVETPAAPAQDDDAGVVKRTWNLLTLKSWRERRAEKHEAERTQAAAAQRRREAERAAAAARESRPAVIGLPLDEMEAQLKRQVEITPDELRALAAARARTVREYLTQAGIAAERIFLEPAGEQTTAHDAPRVTLSLR